MRARKCLSRFGDILPPDSYDFATAALPRSGGRYGLQKTVVPLGHAGPILPMAALIWALISVNPREGRCHV